MPARKASDTPGATHHKRAAEASPRSRNGAAAPSQPAARVAKPDAPAKRKAAAKPAKPAQPASSAAAKKIPAAAKATVKTSTRATAKSSTTGAAAGSTRQRAAKHAPEVQGRRERIALIAYFKAERRGFLPGHEEQDWLEAEAEYEQQSSL